MRAFLAAALILVTVLAGCSGKDPSAEGAEPGHDDLAVESLPAVLTLNVTIGNDTYRFSSDDAVSLPASPSSGTATSSSASTTAAANATGSAGNATATPSGPAPLGVTFELGALRLTDKSGLRWSLATQPLGAAAAGNASAGNGTATGMTLPAKVDRVYNATGSYEVTYSLTLGNRTPQTLDVTIAVSNGTATVQAPTEIPFTVDGTITLGTQGADGCGTSGAVDVAEHEWDLTAVASITKIVAHMDLGDTNVDSDIYLLDPSGAEIGVSDDFNQPGVGTGSPTEDFEVEGPLEPGIYTFRVTGCVGVEAEYTITATATALA